MGDIRLAWGRRGAAAAAARGDVIVVVDVLSFSTTVATAVERGVAVYPCARDEDPHALASAVEADVAVHRTEVPARGRFSLSPSTFGNAPAGARVVLPSPNGATCLRRAGAAPLVLVGALVNATEAAARAAGERTGGLTVVACGERWPDGALRPALEDYLGAGAILNALGPPWAPAAEVCAGAFRQAASRLEELLFGCTSGVELRELGFSDDVALASRLDSCGCAPVLRGNMIAG